MNHIFRGLYYDTGDKIVCLIPRAASTSMRRAMNPARTGFTPHADASTVDFTGKDVLMWLRNPYDRLVSAKKLFWSLTPEQFGARVLSETENVHWIPQTEMHPQATIVMPFESLRQTWRQHFPDVELDRGRETVRPDPIPWADMAQAMPDDMVEAIDQKFAADYAAWSAL